MLGNLSFLRSARIYAYNARIYAYKARIYAYNARIYAYNARIYAYNAMTLQLVMWLNAYFDATIGVDTPD